MDPASLLLCRSEREAGGRGLAEGAALQAWGKVCGGRGTVEILWEGVRVCRWILPALFQVGEGGAVGREAGRCGLVEVAALQVWEKVWGGLESVRTAAAEVGELQDVRPEGLGWLHW